MNAKPWFRFSPPVNLSRETTREKYKEIARYCRVATKAVWESMKCTS